MCEKLYLNKKNMIWTIMQSSVTRTSSDKSSILFRIKNIA